jgi:hypothetical protein
MSCAGSPSAHPQTFAVDTGAVAAPALATTRGDVAIEELGRGHQGGDHDVSGPAMAKEDSCS